MHNDYMKKMNAVHLYMYIVSFSFPQSRSPTILQYSNVYVALPEIHKLLNDTNLQRECLDYVAVPGTYTLLECQKIIRDHENSVLKF